MTDRYDRQTAIPEIGEKGQACLAASTVVIIGVGALGSVEAELLARAGVGHLVFIDPDVVEESNLQRQALYTEADLGRHKAEAAKRHVLAINSSLKVTAIVDRLSPETLVLLERADVVLDGTDNFATRYLMNERCRAARIPCVFAMVAADHGVLFVSRPDGPCLVCALGERSVKDDASTAGILNMTTHFAGTLVAFEAMRILLGSHVAAGSSRACLVATSQGSLFSFGLFDGRFDRLVVRTRADCPVCGK